MAISNLNDDIISQTVLDAFVGALVPLLEFATDFSSDAAQKGDRVSFPLVTTQDTAGDFAGTYTAQSLTAAGTEVVLTAHSYVSMELTDTQITRSSVAKLELGARQKGYSLAKAVFQNILGLALTTSYGAAAFSGTHTGFDSDDVVDVRTACSAANMPLNGRIMVLNSTYYGQLIKDNVIQSTSSFGSPEPIRQGVVPSLHGFKMYESDLVPDNSINLIGFAAVPAAIAIAMRYLEPQDDGGRAHLNVERIVDPNGITLGMREWYTPSTGTRQRVYECVYGYSAAIVEGMKLMVSA